MPSVYRPHAVVGRRARLAPCALLLVPALAGCPGSKSESTPTTCVPDPGVYAYGSVSMIGGDCDPAALDVADAAWFQSFELTAGPGARSTVALTGTGRTTECTTDDVCSFTCVEASGQVDFSADNLVYQIRMSGTWTDAGATGETTAALSCEDGACETVEAFLQSALPCSITFAWDATRD